MPAHRFAAQHVLPALSRTARLGAFVAAVCAAACGSSSKESTATGTDVGSTSTTTGSADGVLTPSGGASCSLSNLSTLSPQSSGVTLDANATNMSTAVPYVLFLANPNAEAGTAGDANKMYEVALFDYDYCAFSAEHGYTGWPLQAFHAAAFYLVDTAASAAKAPSDGTYEVGGGAMSVYVPAQSSGKYGSGMTVTTTIANGNQACAASYPTITSGTVKIAGAQPAATTSGAQSNVTGTFNITFSDNSVLSGDFTSGQCSATAGTPSVASPDLCACTL